MSKKSYRVSAEEFIFAWQTSDNISEVAAKTGMPSGSVRVRGHNYKKKGIPLKKITREKTKDWKALATYAKKVLDEKG